MRAISIKCPNCGALFECEEAAHKAKCTYCGKVSRLQARTGFFARKKPAHQPVVKQPERPTPVQKPRRKKRKGGRGWGWLGSMFFIVIGVVIPMAATGFSTGLLNWSSAKQFLGFAESAERLRLVDTHGGPFQIDINGDAHPDLILMMRQTEHHIVAFDGRDGSQLWISPEITGSAFEKGDLMFHGDVLVLADRAGNVLGFSSKTGAQIWKRSLGEKRASVCAGGAKNVAIRLVDKKWVLLAVGDGSLVPLDSAPDSCESVLSNTRRHSENIEILSRNKAKGKRSKRVSVSVKDMKVIHTAQLVDSPGRYIALGYKSAGSKIPMLASFHSDVLDTADFAERVEEKSSWRKTKKKKPKMVVDWAKELPGLDPLLAKRQAPELLAASVDFIAAIYEARKGPPRVVLFRRTSGERIWDSPIRDVKGNGDQLIHIEITKERVYVTQRRQFTALNVGDGATSFRFE